MKRLLACLVILVAIACKESATSIDIPAPTKTEYTSDILQFSEEEEYYDKVLGALVGSAIGDAMGASTEMWSRKDIQLKYGYITTLTPAIREQSPEGTWEHNLLAGATTDDTRWKYLMAKYLSQNKGDLNATNFTNFIIDYYASLIKSINDNGTIPDTDFLDTQVEKIDWIKEWVRVSMAYKKDTDSYLKAMNRFYGGEMSCAGQLYTPIFGLISETPEDAYIIAYDHALFDIGYAKDISALVSAMTHMALRTKNIDSIINTATFVDPLGYQDSRLVGRISYDMADVSVKKILALNQFNLTDSLSQHDSIQFKMPEGFQGAQKDWTRQEKAYQFLEENEKAIPFHSGEIWQILITALQYGEGNFEKTLQFIVNFGRDNDTVAAVAGMILGAKDGYSNLPVALRTQALKVNKENMGIDLEALASELVAKKYIDFQHP
ncbi:ADP-ribosylglycohydrolase family protein [Zobellia uliginosa]|uniref:ADP-ribosylglycohydrolase family protein n=1 Tax=Zobellia uliginosa TaxID=143224 RepID=UPI001C07CC39|nr:ADP-ribosylglycohydrolase family protein [Zobellia uliginosa]MBU2948745.1 ADP-ribosylglycohydrolase family protein [Zobellia uliginosa]